ncbi:Alcohol dehydrogenase 1 [Armadillidium nasatum]|uniref:Alcohol dehydrogenase 1 n=1 Tax=Armadillidium nasatum TaxID=96803 RepID=A0A5N5SSF4_9CRUS|nr:Alcohol dehydrogenase 1 [Armadillidium nasatum]
MSFEISYSFYLVCLVDICADAGNSLAKVLQDEFGKENVMFAKCDVTSDKEFEDAYNACEKQMGTVSILCNNAGVLAKDYRTTMDTNFGSVVRGTELALKRMGKHNGGEGGFIVNTASVLGAERFPFTPMYCASKAAIIHYTRCMGHEFHYEYSGVHILSVCPCAVDTPSSRPREVAEVFLQAIEEHKPGAALAIKYGLKPFYVTPSLLTEYS